MASEATPVENGADFLSGGGAMGALIRTRDWSDSPLGPPADWPAILKSTVALMLPAAAQIVLFWGPEFVALYNDSYAPTIGDKHPRALGRPARENWAELWDDLEPLLARVRDEGETVSAEDRPFYIERHGAPETVYFDISYSPVRDETGRIGGVLCLVKETTQKVLSEQRVRASEARLRNMADNLPVMVWVTDKDGQCVYLNRYWFDFTGQSEAEALGAGWLDAIHPDDRASTGETLSDATARREPFRLEYRLRRADGVYRWAIDSGAPRFGAKGEFAGFVGSVIDIEERRAAEDALQASEARLRLATEAASVGVWDFNPRSGELSWDAGTRAAFGLSPDAPVDYDRFVAAIHPDDRAATDAAVKRALDPDGPGGYDVEYRTIGVEDGVERWITARGRAVFENGEAVRFIGTVIDISARKAAEAALAREIVERRRTQEALADLNASLEQRIADAIAERERMQEALRQSQKMEAVGQLTGGIAHDFNNLLTVITGNLELAQRQLAGSGNARLERNIANALTGSERAAVLTQRLLAFSRRQPLAPKPIDPNKLVTGMSDLLHRSLGETIAVETVLGAGVWRIEIDPNQLENAILNLAVNARDAMPDGGKLTIETANTHLDRAYVAENSEVLPGQYVAICVTDTGTGMDEETIARAYEPFFTTKEVGKGTGLGLSMVYGFVKQSGGHVKIYSEPGEGTCVKIYLPRLAGDVREDEEKDAAPVPGGDGRETILVCEDDEDVRAYTVEVLRELGYRVLEAVDGPAALRRLEQRDGEIDLLFTDIVLPSGMNGEVLAQQARAMRPDLKVLFTTGYARNAMMHQGRLDPGVELITKPFAYAELAARVRDMLDGGA
ncbi:PAS domain S-box protein [Sphingosinicella sp. YJ22]|uniref:PAS domain S-box protein n=1 Tax=Sphingosinicella sp. YJ22 TaxID=1104780 RepID=UPI00140893B3|nr:PAS domain S-box protein [Sphingosinicella sp. YJ22]